MLNKISFRKKIALNLYSRYKKNITRQHDLRYLFWECTLRCNLNCRHCGSDCKKEANAKDMQVKDFIGVIDQIKSNLNPNKTIVVVTGGEPLMRKDLEDCGKQLYERGFPWGMVTNGYMLDEARLTSLIKSGLRSVTISLDGFEDSHNWLRGKSDSFQKAKNAVLLVSSVNELAFDIVTCVSSKNINELQDLKRMLIGLGVKQWRLFTVFPIGRAKEDSELQLMPDQFKILLDFIKHTRKENLIKASYGCEGFLANYEGEVRDSFFFCRAGINVGSVLVDGSISACPNLRSNFIQGNIYKDNFWDVWENKFQLMRDRSWTKKDECANCSYYKYCLGNGIHLYEGEDNKLIFCHYQKLRLANKN